MIESSGPPQIRMIGSAVSPKLASDSGYYGSNKSTQRSSGSSNKSHESSASSETCPKYHSYPKASPSNGECQPHVSATSGQWGPTRRHGRAKKYDRKLSGGKKLFSETIQDRTKSDPLSIDHVDIASSSTPLKGGQQTLPPESKVLIGNHGQDCIDSQSSTKHLDETLPDSEGNEESKSPGGKWREYFSNNDVMLQDSCSEGTFSAVVTLGNGAIMYTTPSFSNLLGFPNHEVTGRSFADFMHPRDREGFSSHVACGMTFSADERTERYDLATNVTGEEIVKSERLYCRLRKHAKTVGVLDSKSVCYYPFKLTMTLKKSDHINANSKVDGDDESTPQQADMRVEEMTASKAVWGNMNHNEDQSSEFSCANHNLINSTGGCVHLQKVSTISDFHLLIVANQLKSAYQYPEEIPPYPGKFVTRHSANCLVEHMDPEGINYLGHFPQDMIGNSILDYYHPEDMRLMKKIYQGVMQGQGKPFRSKPYRFRTHNGTFAMVETDWSCFVNPWSWKLEFVIGQHRVMQGPETPDVFVQPNHEIDYCNSLTEEVLTESKILQNDIKKLLTEAVTKRPVDSFKHPSSCRKRDLVALLEGLLRGIEKPEDSDTSSSTCSRLLSVMERDSAMLGEISPHHDDQCGSNESSETPPSYNQLNYNENIHRFFESQPKTELSDESAEQRKLEINKRSSDTDSKSSPNIDDSSGSNARLSSGSNGMESGDRDVCASPLTEERLSRHNEAMEKFMLQRHRVLRGKSSLAVGSHKECRHKSHKHHEKVYTPFPVTSSTFLRTIKYDKCSYDIKLLRCQRRAKCRQTGIISHGVKRTGSANWDEGVHPAKHPHLEIPSNGNLPIVGTCCLGKSSNFVSPPFSTLTPGITTSTYSSATLLGRPVLSTCPSLSPCLNGMKCIPEANQNKISEASALPVVPAFFVPCQQHQHFQQQMQLLPTGLLYQPVAAYTCGHPSPMLTSDAATGCYHSEASAGNQLTTTAILNATSSQQCETRAPTKCLKKDYSKTADLKSLISGADPLLSSPSEPMGHKVNILPHGQAAQQSAKLVGNEETGSDESMNCSNSANTKSLGDDGNEVSLFSSEGDPDSSNSESQGQAEISKESAPRSLPTPTTSVCCKTHNRRSMEKIKLTPDLMYKYRVPNGDLSDVLEKDLEALKIYGKQSSAVNDQFTMLWGELNSEDSADAALNLEEGMTSNSSGDENTKEGVVKMRKHPTAAHKYSRMVFLYEEDAPFPPETKVGTPTAEVK